MVRFAKCEGGSFFFMCLCVWSKGSFFSPSLTSLVFDSQSDVVELASLNKVM